jgi:hypothetical protein
LPPSAAAGTDIQQDAFVSPRAQVRAPRAKEKRIRKKSTEKKKVKKRKNVNAKSDSPSSARHPAPTKKKTEKVSSADSKEEGKDEGSRDKTPPKIRSRHYAASIYKGVCAKSRKRWTWRCKVTTATTACPFDRHRIVDTNW